MSTGTVVRIGALIVLFLGGLAGLGALWDTYFGSNAKAVKDIQNKVQGLEQHDQNQDLRIKDHGLQLEKHGRQLDDHELKLDAAQKDLRAHAANIKALEADVAKHLDAIAKLEATAGNHAKELASLKDELSTFQADLNGERKAHQELKAAFETYKNNVETRLKRLERMLKLDNPE